MPGPADDLKDRALSALVKGDWESALATLAALERLEPRAGGWPQKRGELLLRTGRKREALAELVRAADVYATWGHAAKAVAACKAILSIDPGHTATQERLAEIFAHAEAPTRVTEALPPGPDPAAESARPLLEQTLADLVPGSRQAHEFASGEMSAVELAIDFDGPDPAPPPAAFASERSHRAGGISPTALATLRTLPRTPLFTSLEPRDLRTLIEGTELRKVAAGEIVFRQGDPGDSLFVIAEGAVAVLAPHELARLEEGSFFGEIALLVDRGRTATVQARTNTQLLVIRRALLANLIAASPDVLRVVLRFVRDRLVTLLTGTSPLFAPFSEPDRQALARRFRFLELGPGTVVLEQGRGAAGLFIMLAGEATVVRDGRAIATLSSGDVFGEISLLTSQPVTATVSTTVKSFALQLPAAEFRELVLRNEAVLTYVRGLSEDRQREIGHLPVT